MKIQHNKALCPIICRIYRNINSDQSSGIIFPLMAASITATLAPNQQSPSPTSLPFADLRVRDKAPDLCGHFDETPSSPYSCPASDVCTSDRVIGCVPATASEQAAKSIIMKCVGYDESGCSSAGTQTGCCKSACTWHTNTGIRAEGYNIAICRDYADQTALLAWEATRSSSTSRTFDVLSLSHTPRSDLPILPTIEARIDYTHDSSNYATHDSHINDVDADGATNADTNTSNSVDTHTHTSSDSDGNVNTDTDNHVDNQVSTHVDTDGDGDVNTNISNNINGVNIKSNSTLTSTVMPTLTQTPWTRQPGSLSTSDKITLGTALGIGLPATVAGIIAAWYTVKVWKRNKRLNIPQDDEVGAIKRYNTMDSEATVA
ncbi:hypothetical protein F4779DRAFT_610864 [Xylariaceae sp. FL0662B]|nr:hypothetical protein F4779DRAFT_610864 [Xylariaceae sp. FL0662B]